MNETIALQVVTYHSELVLPSFISYLEKLKLEMINRGRNFFCLALDNSNDQYSFEVLLKSSSLFLLLEKAPFNQGFAGGHNYLTKKALDYGATQILIINPDAQIDADNLCLLSDHLSLTPRAGMATPLIYSAQLNSNATCLEPLPTIDAAGMHFTESFRHFDYNVFQDFDNPKYQQQAVSGATGACLLMKKECI